MTEEEWLRATDPTPMLKFLQDFGARRKLQLFVCGMCRKAWPLITESVLRCAVEVSERYADGKVEAVEFDNVVNSAWETTGDFLVGEEEHRANWAATWSVTINNKWFAELAVASLLQEPWSAEQYKGIVAYPELRLLYVELLRDIFGNPFRPVTVLPEWRTSTVLALATGIYEEKAFDRMPILADALQDAGCSNEDILDHCRGPGPHVRGCFLIDLILGKE